MPPLDDTESQAWDINNLGQIVGDYYPGGHDPKGRNRRGFLYDGSNIITFDHPESDHSTYLLGINDNGIITGGYTDLSLGYGRTIGFIATPAPIPEPSTYLLFLFGLVGIVGIKKKLT